MNARRGLRPDCLLLALAFALFASDPVHAGAGLYLPNMALFANPTGFAATFSTSGFVDLRGPFFQSLGTNGRSCASCHRPGEGWSVTPERVRARFEATQGTDPIFRTVDGSNSPLVDVSTLEARRSAYSMLLGKGLIRVGMAIPPNAEFELAAVDDPYGFASAGELSLFRRPLPSTNLTFLNTVMWDGRETFRDAASADCLFGTTTCYASLHYNLMDQSNVATLGHAEADAALSDELRQAIVDFERSIFTAQVFDSEAGELNAAHALGGPDFLSAQQYYFGINDLLAGDYRTGVAFSSLVFRLYDAWDPKRGERGRSADGDRRDAARAAVVRGQSIFNTRPMRLTRVKGLNDDLGAAEINGTCTSCHDTPSSGNHSIPMPLDIGLTDLSRRTPDLPLYTLRNRTTRETVETTDPGRALVTGRWRDIGRFKGPVLRGLASRAPYFHNGSAAGLDDVLDFYNTRFELQLSDDEKRDLVAFLRTL